MRFCEESRDTTVPEIVTAEAPAVIVVPWTEIPLETTAAAAPLGRMVVGAGFTEGSWYAVSSMYILLPESTDTGVPETVAAAAPCVMVSPLIIAPFVTGDTT